MFNFKNTFINLPHNFYEKINPEEFLKPQILAYNSELAAELNIDVSAMSQDTLSLVFSGQKIMPGSEPIAMAYAGFQFGHPVPQLGDGRAHLLGEVSGYDIQLKGSGRTRFSRQGDGRSALGPVIREYLVSEAMYALGVPTTRALCAVRTGESVLRQYGKEPGGILTRVAESHLRVGHFQYFAFQEDLDSLEILLEYCLKRHYPELLLLPSKKEKAIELIKALIHKQSDLIAQWISLGFIHGVMNTDNFSMCGITLDFGPCAFIDEFNYEKVFSSIDSHSRYSYWNQISIAQWNILRLADCLLPFIDNQAKSAIQIVEKEVQDLLPLFFEKSIKALARKLGIQDYINSDQKLVFDFLKYLEKNELDFTLSFRNLKKLYEGETKGYLLNKDLNTFLVTWKERVKDLSHLNKINPLYIPRNHLIENAIERVYKGDEDFFHRFHQVLKNPFQYNKNQDEWAQPPKPEERVAQTFCGT